MNRFIPDSRDLVAYQRAPRVKMAAEEELDVSGETDADQVDLEGWARELLQGNEQEQQLGSVLTKLVSKVKSAIKKRRAARKAGTAAPASFEVSTPIMRATVGPEGLTIARKPADQGVQLMPREAPGLMEHLKANPWLAIVPAGALVAILLIVASRRRS